MIMFPWAIQPPEPNIPQPPAFYRDAGDLIKPIVGSLMVNQLCGFGAGSQAQNPVVEFTNQYTFTFAGTPGTATVTVPAIDLGPAAGDKQILVCAQTESPVLASITINGVNAPFFLDENRFVYYAAADYTGSGPFDIVLTCAGASTEANGLTVYEVTKAPKLYECSRSIGTNRAAGTAAVEVSRRVPVGASVVAAAMFPTDTVTATWAGVTEDADADVGASRNTSGHTTDQVTASNTTISVTPSASTTIHASSLVIPKNEPKLRGGVRRYSTTTFNTTTATFSTGTDYTGLGNFKLVCGIAIEANVTVSSVTFNGNAMTQIASVVYTTPSPDIVLYFYAIDVTQAGPSGSIVITASASITGFNAALTAWHIYNFNSFGTPQSTTGNGTGSAVSVDVTENGMILAIHCRATETQTITWTGVHELVDDSVGLSNLFSYGSADYAHAAAETGRSVQAVGSASGEHATLVLPIS